MGNKIPNFSGVASYMASEGSAAAASSRRGDPVPDRRQRDRAGRVFKPASALALLLTFLALATYYFHDFWNFQGQEQQMQMIQFLKNSVDDGNDGVPDGERTGSGERRYTAGANAGVRTQAATEARFFQ